MGDDPYGKQKFIDALKSLGKNDQEIEVEWQKFLGNLGVSMIKEGFNFLSEDERDTLLAGLNPSSNPQDVVELFKRTDKFFYDHPEKIADKKAFFEKIVDTTKKAYSISQ